MIEDEDLVLEGRVKEGRFIDKVVIVGGEMADGVEVERVYV